MEQSVIEKLASLKSLLDAGVLSKEEFEVKKKELLSETSNASAKKPKKNLAVIALAILAALVIGGYIYSRSSKATLASVSYKESVEGITIGVDYDAVFEQAKNDEEAKKMVMGLTFMKDKSEIGWAHKEYRGVTFDLGFFYFSSGTVSSIELRKTANEYNGDAAQIIQEAYNRVVSSLRGEYSSFQDTDAGMVFFNEYEKVTVYQEQDFSGQFDLYVKIEKK